MSLIALGRKEKSYAEPSITGSSKKAVIRYPSFSVNNIELPLDQKDVGKIVPAVVYLRVNKAGAEIDEYGSEPNKKKHRAEFSVMSIDFAKKKVNIKDVSEFDLDEAEKAEHARIGKK